MSEGYCADDDCENWRYLLGNIGFVENGKVIQDKLKALILLTWTNDGYETSKILLGTKNNYIFYFDIYQSIIYKRFTLPSILANWIV